MTTTEQTERVFRVKVLRPGRKRWEFLSSNGRTNSLRIHAINFRSQDDAKEQATYIEANNPGFKAKVVLA